MSSGHPREERRRAVLNALEALQGTMIGLQAFTFEAHPDNDRVRYPKKESFLKDAETLAAEAGKVAMDAARFADYLESA